MEPAQHMQIVNQPVSYAERCIRTNSGTAVIWPFLNVEKGIGPYELFLDTNALTNVQWFAQLPEEIRTKSVINPWPALLEQWLSNPQFRKSTTDRINTMIESLARLGAPFRDQFAQQQERLLRKNDAALRTQFSGIIPYVAIMKSLLAQKLFPEQALQRLEGMMQEDIPRFTSAIMLTALGTLLKGSQSLKLADDHKPAFSYLNSFLAFQSGQKDETDHINVAYLRNRAGDLNLWLTLPLLRQKGYRFVGTPAIVTGDRALHRLIIRVIPPVLLSNLAMSVSLSPEGLPTSLCQRISDIANSVQVRSDPTPEELLTRMSNLFDLAKACCADERERHALDQVFSGWWRPGFGRQIDLS